MSSKRFGPIIGSSMATQRSGRCASTHMVGFPTRGQKARHLVCRDRSPLPAGSIIFNRTLFDFGKH